MKRTIYAALAFVIAIIVGHAFTALVFLGWSWMTDWSVQGMASLVTFALWVAAIAGTFPGYRP
jgi:hypothetical protein